MSGKKSKADMSLDVIIKWNKKKQRQQNTGFQASGNRRKSQGKPAAVKGRNNNSYFNKFNASRGKPSLQTKRKEGQNSNVGGRMLKNAFNQPAASFRSKLNDKSGRPSNLGRSKGNIGFKKDQGKKSTLKMEEGGQLRLFTKNFDARSKIQAKRAKNSNVDSIRNDKRGEKGAARAAQRASLQESRRKLGIPTINNLKSNSNIREQQGRLSNVKGQSVVKGRTLPKKTNIGGSVQYPGSRAESGTVVTCEYDEPLVRVERTIHPQTTYYEDERTLPQTVKTINRPQMISNTYTTQSSGLKQKQSGPAISKNSNKIVISNLHPNVTTEDIRELFGAVGDFVTARLIRPGIAEVIYEYPDDALLAYKKYHSRNLDGQPMYCKLMSTEPVMYQPTSTRSRETATSRPSTKPVVFTVKI